MSDALPIDVLALIFCRLRVCYRIDVLSLVCRRWRIAARRSVTALKLISRYPSPNIGRALSLFPSLTDLTLRAYGQSSPVQEDLPVYPLQLPLSLRRLRLKYPPDIDGYWCRPFGIHPTAPLPSLTHLALIMGSDLAALLPLLSASVSTLTSLQLALPMVVEKYISDALNSLHFPSLTHFDFSRQHQQTFPVFDIKPILCNFISRHTSQLTSLALRWARASLDAEVLSQLMTPFPILRTLDLFGSYACSLGWVCRFVESCPKLQSVRLNSLLLIGMDRDREEVRAFLAKVNALQCDLYLPLSLSGLWDMPNLSDICSTLPQEREIDFLKDSKLWPKGLHLTNLTFSDVAYDEIYALAFSQPSILANITSLGFLALGEAQSEALCLSPIGSLPRLSRLFFRRVDVPPGALVQVIARIAASSPQLTSIDVIFRWAQSDSIESGFDALAALLRRRKIAFVRISATRGSKLFSKESVARLRRQCPATRVVVIPLDESQCIDVTRTIIK